MMDHENSSISKMLRNIETTEIDKMKATLSDLYSVWSEIGIDETQIVSRIETTFSHIHSLVHDIYEEEVSLRAELKGKCITFSEEMSRLAEKLAVPISEIPDVPMIRKIKLLQQELDSLYKLSEKRKQDFKELKVVENKYCQLLDIGELQLSSKAEIPSITVLNKLESHVQNLLQEHKLRYDKYIHTQNEILSILKEVEIPPENRLEENIFSGTQPDSLSKNTLMLVEKTLDKVKTRKNTIEKQKNDLINKLAVLWKRLDIENKGFLSNYPDPKDASLKYLQQEIKRCEEIKRMNIESFINTLREELKDIWTKCGVSDSGTQLFSPYFNAEASEDILVAHEEEVDKWKKYYEKCKPLLEKIQKRDKLWELLKALDAKANDPNRLKNRGGNLLKEEKERNRLIKTLPALENQILQEIENYEKETGREFIYKEENYKFLVTKQWEERSNRKENLKLDKELAPTLPTASPAFSTPPSYNTPSTKPRKLHTSAKSNTPKFRICKPAKFRPTPRTSKKALQKRELGFVKTIHKLDIESIKDVTMYSNFVKELNSPVRRHLRSTKLTSKNVADTRLSKTSKNRSLSELNCQKRKALDDQHLLNKSKECPF